jgi:plastocyanin
VRSRGGPHRFDSGNLEPGESFTYRFQVEGRYPYLDEREEDERGEDEGTASRGTVIVQATAITPLATAQATAIASASQAPATAPLVSTPPLASTPPVASAGPSLPALPAPIAVDIVDRAFAPADVTVVAGETVEWTNRDGEGHTVTASDGSFDSGLMAGGMTFARRFDTPGTIRYACAIHPEMRGSVTITAALASASPPVQASPVPASPAAATPTGPAPSVAMADPGEALVSIADISYQPATLEVTAGTTVRWRNDDPVAHTVTARDGSFMSPVLTSGDEFSQVFETPGTFPYFCAIHPGQVGSVVVTVSD